jgi:hypothetical protein
MLDEHVTIVNFPPEKHNVVKALVMLNIPDSFLNLVSPKPMKTTLAAKALPGIQTH